MLPNVMPRKGYAMSRHLVHQCIALAIFAVVFLPQPVRAGGGSCQTGPGLFDYGPHRDNVEAELLAMDLTGALRAPDHEYNRILRDLALIRTAYPILGPEIDGMDYVPTELTVKMDPAVSWSGYDALNQYYQVIDDRVFFGDWRILTFCDNINPNALRVEYEALPEVLVAEPDYMIGVANFITISLLGDTYRYDIEDGFHDCTDSCDCARLWLIDVAADGTVTLQSYSEYGPWSWCVFEDVACCQDAQGCMVTSVEPCVAGGGRPLEIGQACTACDPSSVPAVSEWGLVILVLLTFVTGSAVSRNSPRA